VDSTTCVIFRSIICSFPALSRITQNGKITAPGPNRGGKMKKCYSSSTVIVLYDSPVSSSSGADCTRHMAISSLHCRMVGKAQLLPSWAMSISANSGPQEPD
jgi:hypothetical protein